MAERYFVAGETQDTAILFVPSEAIYADLCEHFSDLVQKAHRARIVICAPNMLMLAVQTMQAILKDVKMREQAHLIQREVAKLMDDVGRLRDRVVNLQRHFDQTHTDLSEILTSADKIGARGRKIETLDFEEPPASAVESPHNGAVPAPSPAASPPNGQGELRRVGERRNGGPRIVRQPDLLARE
jgi:DNA recombination protein RmuC